MSVLERVKSGTLGPGPGAGAGALVPWDLLCRSAWAVLERAQIYARRKVGCAVLDESGALHVGCNVEQCYRSHDIHAEVNALAGMVAGGGTRARALVVVADSPGLYSCGACLDFIMQLGGPDCELGFQWQGGGRVEIHRAGDMLPFCPQ